MLELTFDAIVGTRTCYVAAKLGIADLLSDGARTSDELAVESGVIQGRSTACSVP